MKTKALAMITARGGSKRIPGKNYKEFCGKPILLYSIEAALKSGVFDEVMVSTDDETIAKLARNAGAKVPFMRSEATANDYATTDEVIYEVLKAYEACGVFFDAFCCIYPTAPFITADILQQAMSLLDTAASVMPVVPFSYPPLRSLVIKDSRLVRKYPEFANTRSQDLEVFYHDCGQFYACRTDAFMQEKTTDVEDLVPMILNETMVQDIDTKDDWAIAECKYKMLQENKDK